MLNHIRLNRHLKLLIKPTPQNKGILQFIVKDSGAGIPEEKQQYVYEQFTRLIPANKGTYKGLGLGLTIVKQFMQDLGGEIEIKSHLRKGSVFTCTIPFKLPLTHTKSFSWRLIIKNEASRTECR